MTLQQLKLTCDAPGIGVVQTLRGEVEPRNPYSQWNLCDYTGDDALRVLNARLTFCQQMGIALDQLVMPRQSHTTHVAVIDQDFFDADIAQQEQLLNDIDALVTALPGICIGVNTADCVPIALADPTHGIIAIAHAGWRGTVGRIAQRTVETMCRLGATPADIHATMGASICVDCFEVGDEVPQAFEQAGFDMTEIVRRNATTGKAHIDLWRANRQVLLAAGIPADHITLPTACSRCHSDRYFSARRLGIHSGRTFTAIMRTPNS
jgi:YfiH family protein